jgi:RNA polymerase sigma-70 factor, ECF subfamily
VSAPSAAPPLGRDSTASAEAASVLFERHRQRILAFCLSRTRNRSDAEDATQTTFMYALSGLKRGVVPEFESSWLYRIAENVCHSQRRRAHRRYERDELPIDVASDQGGDPALVSERLETLSSALEGLPETQRRAIILREWRGLSYDDIAAELQTSHAAVETLLFRARRSMAKRVASFGTLGLQLLPSGARVVRWACGTGVGKAAVVAATAVTVGAGLAADGATSARDDQLTTPAVRSARFAGTTRDGSTRAVVEFERAAPKPAEAAGDPATEIAETQATPVGATGQPAAPPVGPSTGAPPASAGSSDQAGVAPIVDLRVPIEEVVAAVDPVEELIEPALDDVRGLEPLLPPVPVVEALPEVELPASLPPILP